jgi:long-chain fatty acid transport protein
MKKVFNWTRPIAILLGVCVAGSALATNGYFTHGTGTKNKGMVGAGIALPQDAIDTVNNPAVAVLVGNSMQIGAALFNPNRTYHAWGSYALGQGGAFTIGEGTFDSSKNYFVIPHFSRSWQRPSGNAFAVSFYGRGGMNTTWKTGSATFDPDGPFPQYDVMTLPGTFGDGQAGVDYSQAFLDLTWAKQITERTSFGIAGIMGMQMFEATGVQSFAGYTETFATGFMNTGGPVPVSNLSNNGHDFAWGYGVKLGLHTKLSDKTSFGIMYQSRIDMTEFDDYADLFAEDGDMDVPANLKIGLTRHIRKGFSISFDIEHTWYNDVEAPGNSIMNLFACPTAMQGGMDLSKCLGGENGGGFGWEDMTTYKIGFQWNNGYDWTWRAGFSYGEHPIPVGEMTFNILAPGLMEQHLTFGFTKQYGKYREWNFAFMYAPKNAQTGPNNFDPTQTLKWEMDQYELELSYGWRF